MSCQKTRYASRADAKREAQKFHKRVGSPKQRPYRCTFGCDAWHLTSTTSRRDERRIDNERGTRGLGDGTTAPTIRQCRRRIERLSGRVEWLRHRIASHPERTQDQTQAEIVALEWALPILQAHVEELAADEGAVTARVSEGAA